MLVLHRKLSMLEVLSAEGSEARVGREKNFPHHSVTIEFLFLKASNAGASSQTFNAGGFGGGLSGSASNAAASSQSFNQVRSKIAAVSIILMLLCAQGGGFGGPFGGGGLSGSASNGKN